MRWHCLRNPAPAAEGIALLRWFGFRRNACSIFHVIALVFLTVNGVGQLVGVNGERACHRHVMGWHCFGYLTPAREGIALLRGFGFGRDACTELNIVTLVFLAVDGICQLIDVDSKRAYHRHVMGWHCFWNLTPAREGIALLRGFFLGCDTCIKFHVVALVFLTVDDVCKLIGVDRERTCYRHVMRWHCLWNLTPARKSVPFFNRSFYRKNRRSNHYEVFFVELPIYPIYYVWEGNNFQKHTSKC